MKTALLILSTMTVITPSTSGAEVASRDWKLLAPLPDPVGFGGMFAGVLGGRLVAGGGSQFREKPVWLQGTKSYSDRIFTLSSPDAKWQVHAERLPEKNSHFAAAASSEAIYLVGGLNADGGQQACWELRARGDGFAFNRLPDLPSPLCYGAAAIVGGRLFVAGGQRQPTDKAASAEAFSLELGAPHVWRREPNLPGPGVFVASAATEGSGFFLFGGMAFDAEGKFSPSSKGYRFDPAARRWEQLPDLPEPRVGAATPCPVLPDGKIFLIGGYAAVFPGAPREHPGFSAQTLRYDVAQRRWENGPVLPRASVPDRDSPGDAGPGPMLAAPCALWENLAVVVSGEVRASTRTPAVIAWPLAAGLDGAR